MKNIYLFSHSNHNLSTKSTVVYFINKKKSENDDKKDYIFLFRLETK
jgi:hypothetical protein